MAVPFVIPEGAIPLDQLPPEDQAELQSISPPVAPAVPEGAIPMDELIRTASPEDLFDLTVQSADSDSPFDPKRYLVNNPEIRKDDNLVRKLADADAYVRDRGFELSDIDLGKALGGLWHIGKSFVYDRPKMGLSAAASAVKSQTADTEKEREKEKLKWLRGTTEALAAQELAAFDFIGLFNKAGGKVKDLVSSPLTRPPDERLNDFLSRVDDDVQRDNISKGKGATFEAIFGEGVAENLAAAGEAVDPEVVSAVSASDPLVFMAFPGGIKIVHAATGKVLGSAVSKIGAGKIVSTLRRAERAAAQSTAKSEAAAGRVGALEAGPAVAAPLIVESTPVLERMAQTQAGVARTAAVTAAEEANVSQAVLRSAEEAFNASTPAKLMVGADRLVQPIRQGAEEMISRTIDAGLGVGVGAVGLGATMAEKLGKTIAAFIPPIATPRALRTSYELAGQGGKRLLGVSKELFKGKQSSYSPALTMASDVFATVPITASGAVRGLVTMDIPFAAVASERPEDTAHMPVIGAFLGGAGRAVPIARQIVRNQRIRARDYGSDAPLRDYRNASGLDAGNKFSVEQGEPGQASRLSALRQMLEPTGAQMYWLSDPKQFADAIRRYFPGKTEAWYENASRTKGVADVIIDDAGQPKKVIILNDLEAAEHEAVHPIEKILGKRATDEVFDLIYDEYLPIWEQFGESYARQFTSSEQWQNYLARGEGWREAVLDASQGTTEWRSQLTPDQIHEFGDRYIAGEFLAEAGDAIIKHAGPDIVTSPSFPGKLARILGKVLVGFGVEPFAGVETAGQGIPLRFETTEKLATALKRGVDEAAVDRSRPDVGGVPPYSPKGKPRPPVESRSGVVPSQPVEPTEPAAAAEEARVIAAELPAATTPAARGQRSSKEVLGDVAENIATGEGLKVDYRSAPGEPAGAISSDRTTRRAIIEAFRVMPQSARSLFEKLFFPDRVIKTAGGKIQVMGWAPEVFAANAHKLASSLKEAGELDWWNGQFPRYGVDAKTGTFTEPGWRALYDDVQVFTRNQRAGETGSGESLVVPAATEARGFRAPLPRDVPAGALEQKYADVISSLFGIPIPKTPRITSGRFPRNLAGQEVSEATMPGRVSELVQPRAPFEGAAAEELGITGRQLQEVNPVRAELESRGVKPSYIEAIQRLNLESIADVQSAGKVPQFRGVEFTLQAGFQPKPKDPRAIKAVAVRFPSGKIYEGYIHGDALEAGRRAGEVESSAGVEDGFITNNGEFLSRDAALERALELKQISKERVEQLEADKDESLENIGGLEAIMFDRGRRFQPRPREPRAIKSAAVRFPSGKIYEGKLHGNALEEGYRAGEPESSVVEDGFTANNKEFLSREAALERAIELEQLSKRKDDGGLESFTFDVGRRFQPRLEETVQQIRDADMDQLRELVKAPSRFGSSLTGFAYELGAGLKEANQLRTLEDARLFHVSESKRALQAKDYGSAALNGNKAQILREAIEFSTGTGSGEMARVRDFPDFEPPLRGQTQFQPREAKTEAGKELEKKGFQFVSQNSRVEINKNGKTVGSLYFTNFGETAKIHEIWVTNEFRKQGLAEALYREVFTDWEASGVKEVTGVTISPIPFKIRNRILPGQTFTQPRVGGALDVRTTIPPNAKFQPRREDEGSAFLPEPNKDVEDIAVKYAKDIGLTYTPKLNILELNPELSKRIADYYQNSKTDPEDAAVKKSYDALINETTAQWKAIEDAGYTMTPSKNEPYKTSKEMLEDVRENRNLSFLKTSPETIKSAANNPMLRPSGVGDLSANDLFRAVHDFFGHAKGGYQFGPKGELNAWRAHSEMFSPEAQGALAAETLAQNSWVNFGPHLRDSAGKIAERGEEGYVAPPDRPFAEQKNIVLPEKLLREVTETLRSVRSDPQRAAEVVEPLERLAELQEQTAPDLGTQFMPTLAQLEAKWAREERLAARRKPVKKKPTFQMITGVAGGFSKAWLQPDGEPIQLGGTWHHEWLAENAKAVGDQWSISLKQAKSSDADISRKAALEAGFARVNLGLSNGALTVELRAKDLRKHKKSIFDLVEQNSGLVDNITITLFDDAVRNVLDNASESVFRYDTAEKLEHIPFITTGPEAPTGAAGGGKRGPGAIARARALPDAAQFQAGERVRSAQIGEVLEDGEVLSKRIPFNELAGNQHEIAGFSGQGGGSGSTTWRFVDDVLYWWGEPSNVQRESVKAHLEKKRRVVTKEVFLNDFYPESKTFENYYNRMHGELPETEAQFQTRKPKGYFANEYWVGPGGLQFSKYGHEEAAVNYLKKVAPDLGIKHSGGLEETAEQRYSTYNEMENRGWLRATETGEAIEIDSSSLIKSWDGIPRKSRQALEDIAFEKNKPILFDNKVAFEKPRPDAGFAQFQPGRRGETEGLPGMEVPREPLTPRGLEIRAEAGKNSVLITAHVDKNQVGSIDAEWNSQKQAKIGTVFVKSDFRRRGVGEALYERLKTELVTRGMESVRGNLTSQRALRLREKVFGEVEMLGYSDVGFEALPENPRSGSTKEISAINYLSPAENLPRPDVEPRFKANSDSNEPKPKAKGKPKVEPR